tara:strand:- start:192 stop:413 length:222 start_codon:yes stop_codon:yes gene_type:complete
MFGFSLSKLLILIALIVIVWYGFKAVGRVNQKRRARGREAGRNQYSELATENMIQCPKCGAYTASLDAHKCEA